MGRKQRRSGVDEKDLNAAELQRRLVQHLKDNDLLPDVAVEAAFRAVSRHLFLPFVPLDTVYTDEAIPTKRQDGVPVSSSSQPAVMAIMLDQLEVRPGQSVLEIGAGTGYNAALMAYMVGPSGHVTTMDIDEDIVNAAREHLESAGFGEVQVVRGDGAMGYLPNAPYDRIILTVGAWDIAPAWSEQLAPGGRLVLPLALNGTVQKLVAFEKGEDHLESVSIRDGSFMPLRGALASPPMLVRLSTDGDCILSLSTPRFVDVGTVYDLLTGPYRDIETSIQVTQDDLWGGVSLWLALQAPGMCGIMARGEAASRGIIPGTVGRSPSYTATMGLLEDTGLCLLARSPDDEPASDVGPFTLNIRSYGSDSGPAEHLMELLQEWDRAGRPSSAGLRIRAYPRDASQPIDGGSASIDKPYTKLVLDWASKDS